MFGENQLNQTGSVATYTTPGTPQQEFGVASAIKELIEISKSVRSGSDQLKSLLGISGPPSGSGEKAVEVPQSLVGILRGIASMLGHANIDLQDSIRHIQN